VAMTMVISIALLLSALELDVSLEMMSLVLVRIIQHS
jgi:hypothetical protein